MQICTWKNVPNVRWHTFYQTVPGLIVIALTVYILILASKFGASLNVIALILNTLIFWKNFWRTFWRTPRTFSYSLTKLSLNYQEINLRKYLNVMAWELKFNLPQVRKLRILQYLSQVPFLTLCLTCHFTHFPFF